MIRAFPGRGARAASLLIGAAIAATLGATPAAAADRLSARQAVAPEAPGALKLDAPLSGAALRPNLGALDPSLAEATGTVQVIVRLSGASTAALAVRSGADRALHKRTLEAAQGAFVSRVLADHPSARVLGQVQHVLNAVFLEVPTAALESIARDGAVTRVAPVGHYRLDLSETVPLIGGDVLQAAGLDGAGVSVAVLDSGVDYTHADLGGTGDPADYVANDGTIIEPGTFPTAKVVGGFDFLGNEWPDGDVLPDPDPLDDLALEPEAFAGHGTHVADIIAGVNGVAPGADLYAVKVCASLSSACNGIALIQGMEFSVDPNGDGDTSDHVDVINMSLGADYGQAFDDDLSTAVDAATAIGSLTVSSAGNCGDRPYCTGTPSSAPSALAVAQTQVPSATGFLMEVIEPAADAGTYGAVLYPWTPAPTTRIEGPVTYGDGAGGNLNGCAPFAPGSLEGAIVLMDRGACFFSDKIRNAQEAGAVVGIVGLVAPGAPFAGGFGGGAAITIPGFNISQADANILRTGAAVVAFGPDLSFSLAGTTVSSTARGPSMSGNRLKPEIGAPGASVSAVVATGTDRGPFGGTSGASPMVAGSAALLLQECRDSGERAAASGADACAPAMLKAKLMNNAFREIVSDTTGDFAEITRIGAGEVRVDDAAAASMVAYGEDGQPTLGLGFLDVSRRAFLRRTVEIENRGDNLLFLDIEPTFRFPDKAATGAVQAFTRSLMVVPPGRSRPLPVYFRIDPAALGGNAMSSGITGNDPAALSAMEYAGYLTLTDRRSGEQVALPWHVLPRRAAEVTADTTRLPVGNGSIALRNRGEGTAQNDAYTIVALSDEKPRGPAGGQAPMPDLRAVGVNTIPVPAGFCSAEPSFLWLFAFNTWDRQTHLLPVSHEIELDVDRDGIFDYVVLNRDLSGLGTLGDGRQVSWVFDIAAGEAEAFFFAEHATNTGNTVLTICAEQIGLGEADLLATTVDARVITRDFYYGGGDDVIEGLSITPLGEGLVGAAPDLEAGETGTLDITDFGPWPGNSPEFGVMLFTNGDRGEGNRGGATEDTEAPLFLSDGVRPPAPL